MKKILVINSGSSSLKFQLFATDGNEYKVIIKGLAERIGIDGSNISYQKEGEKKQVETIPLDNHKTTLKAILDILLKGSLKSIDELWAIGHRLGHGGEYFDKSVVIDDEVMEKIYETKDLLPLHGNAFVYGIEAMKSLLPNIKQVATFDSAFHQTMPKEAFLYALPLEQYEKYRIRRYGFHGTSHYYVSNELRKIMPSAEKIISCHLGSGSSITAIKNGKSIDTSFGFAASCGVTMGTRCGDIDAYIPLYIMQTQNKTADEVNQMMNKESGLWALSGGYSDTRDIEKMYNEGNEQAITTINIYVHNVIKYIGAYTAEMGGVDAIIFTAGIGENSSFLRQKICERLKFMGVEIDEEKNKLRSQFVELSTPASKVKVYMIPTNEELVIAQDTYKLCA
ncbi:MAG: acetate kinase [Alphaproteobacteria bacterium]|nr:acetate kinase [Alphaproteobacteria bacterium]